MLYKRALVTTLGRGVAGWMLNCVVVLGLL